MLFGPRRDKVRYSLTRMMACYCVVYTEVETVCVYCSVPCMTHTDIFKGGFVNVDVDMYGNLDS